MILALDPKTWDNVDKAKALAIAEAVSRGHIQTDAAEAIIAHEYGHALTYSAMLHRVSYSGAGALTNLQYLALRSELDTFPAVVQKYCFPELSENEANLDICKHLGSRAADDPLEFIAESIAHHYYGGDSYNPAERYSSSFRGYGNEGGICHTLISFLLLPVIITSAAKMAQCASVRICHRIFVSVSTRCGRPSRLSALPYKRKEFGAQTTQLSTRMMSRIASFPQLKASKMLDYSIHEEANEARHRDYIALLKLA